MTGHPLVPAGLTDTFHCSTVAVVLWALQDTPVSASLKLVVDDVLDGGVGPVTLNNPRWEKRA